ncbi:hypothetical protein [Streptomyces sp. NPDC051577]|uniref:hypothetical protein n=1 Tax=unclassified Streptomyces TaxID=2593676 RepID=UPI003435599A
MKTHSGGYPAPTTVPAEEQVRTCRTATGTSAAENPAETDGQSETIIRGED